jgi:hypothetical protein
MKKAIAEDLGRSNRGDLAEVDLNFADGGNQPLQAADCAPAGAIAPPYVVQPRPVVYSPPVVYSRPVVYPRPVAYAPPFLCGTPPYYGPVWYW